MTRAAQDERNVFKGILFKGDAMDGEDRPDHSATRPYENREPSRRIV
jgi:hypothetical protein